MATDAEILAIAVPQLAIDEGVKTAAYLDTKGIPTIGVGHTGREVHMGLYWPMAECLAQLSADIHTVLQGLDTALPLWRSLNAARGAVLVNIGFNVGVHGLLEFHHMLSAAFSGDWSTAAREILDSEIAPARAQRLAGHMVNGT